MKNPLWIHLNQYTPTLTRCRKMPELTSSVMVPSSPPWGQHDHHNHRKEASCSFSFSHGNYSSMFSLSAKCLFWWAWWCWCDIWGAMSQDCHEHIPLFTWLVNANRWAHELHQSPTSGPHLCAPHIAEGKTLCDKTSGQIHICVLKQGCLGCRKDEHNLLNTAHVWLGRWQSHNATILASEWPAGISWFSLGGD